MLFNNEFAAVVQTISFPLEVIGITLATIEVRYDALTERINLALKAQVAQWETAKIKLREKHPLLYKLHGGNTGLHMPVPYSMYIFLTVLLLGFAITVAVVIGLTVLTKTGNVDADTATLYLDLNRGFMFYFLFPLSGGVIFALGIVFIAVKFVANRAVGTLGIVIASIGLSGEAYQLVVQLVN